MTAVIALTAAGGFALALAWALLLRGSVVERCLWAFVTCQSLSLAAGAVSVLARSAAGVEIAFGLQLAGLFSVLFSLKLARYGSLQPRLAAPQSGRGQP